MKKFLFLLFISLFSILIIISLTVGGYILRRNIEYSLNKAVCQVSISDKVVFTGRCQLITLTVLNSFTDRMMITIYEDIYKIKPEAYYVDKNIKVTTLDCSQN